MSMERQFPFLVWVRMVIADTAVPPLLPQRESLPRYGSLSNRLPMKGVSVSTQNWVERRFQRVLVVLPAQSLPRSPTRAGSSGRVKIVLSRDDVLAAIAVGTFHNLRCIVRGAEPKNNQPDTRTMDDTAAGYFAEVAVAKCVGVTWPQPHTIRWDGRHAGDIIHRGHVLEVRATTGPHKTHLLGQPGRSRRTVLCVGDSDRRPGRVRVRCRRVYGGPADERPEVLEGNRTGPAVFLGAPKRSHRIQWTNDKPRCIMIARLF